MKLVMQAVSLLLAMIGVPVDTNKTPFVSEEDIFCQSVFCLVPSCFLQLLYLRLERKLGI